MKDPVTFNSFMLPLHLGGLTLVSSPIPDSNSSRYEVEHAKSIRLIYVLDCSDQTKKELAAVWETGALEVTNMFLSKNMKVGISIILFIAIMCPEFSSCHC